MEQSELETKILELLQDSAALEYSQIRQQLLYEPRRFSLETDAKLRVALQDLVARGELTAPTIWGPFQLNKNAVR